MVVARGIRTVSMVGHGWLFMSSIGDNFVTGDKDRPFYHPVRFDLNYLGNTLDYM